MVSPQLSGLKYSTPTGHPLAQLTLALQIHCAAPVDVLGPKAADAIEKYLPFVGPDLLKRYVSTSGARRPLTARQIARDLKRLRKLPDGMHTLIVEYDSDPDGYIGDRGVYFIGSDFTEYFDGQADNLLRLDFSLDTLERVHVDDFLAFVVGLLSELPFESAGCGYAFRRGTVVDQDVVRWIRPLIVRYLAIDPGYDDLYDIMRGRILSAHWIDALGTPLLEKLQSRGAGAVPTAVQTTTLRNGLLLRSAKHPPIGDVNARAPDVGALPDVARWLLPLRLPKVAFGEPNFDGKAWLARLDQMPSRSWDNA